MGVDLRADAMDDIPCGAVDRLVSCGVGDVLVRRGRRIVVEKQWVVRVLFCIPVKEIREWNIALLQKIYGRAELQAGVCREVIDC